MEHSKEVMARFLELLTDKSTGDVGYTTPAEKIGEEGFPPHLLRFFHEALGIYPVDRACLVAFLTGVDYAHWLRGEFTLPGEKARKAS